MAIEIRSELEERIIDFVGSTGQPHDLAEIVKQFRGLTDDASIKAALHRLSAEGLLQITPEWKFRTAAVGAR
jgi:DNA-binding GntR family transcriptional regulator